MRSPAYRGDHRFGNAVHAGRVHEAPLGMVGILSDPTYQHSHTAVSYLLRVLGDHEHQLEVVHSQCDVV